MARNDADRRIRTILVHSPSPELVVKVDDIERSDQGCPRYLPTLLTLPYLPNEVPSSRPWLVGVAAKVVHTGPNLAEQ